MQLRPDQLLTGARPLSRLGKIVQFPLMRMLIAVLFLVPVLAINKAFKTAVYPAIGGNAVIVLRYLEAAVFFALFIVAYRLYTKYIEKRPAMEVGAAGWFQETGWVPNVVRFGLCGHSTTRGVGLLPCRIMEPER